MKKRLKIMRLNKIGLQICGIVLFIFFITIINLMSESGKNLNETTQTYPITTTITTQTSVITFSTHTTTITTTTSITSTTSSTTTTETTSATTETSEIIEIPELEISEEYYEESYEETDNRTYLGTFKITHYCPCEYCCGECTGITASGTVAVSGRTIGMSNTYEFGTQIEINGNIYIVEDRGGFSENTIDIFCDTHEEALEKGCYYAEVYMIN